jgi:hypothetical protein
MAENLKTVLVLGTARSGTSMTAGILSTLGVFMGETSNQSPQNPKGSFENPDFIDITSSMHLYLKSGKTCLQLNQKYGKALEDAIKKHQKSPIWGFKSALSHHFANLIVPKLPNPYLVIVFRNVYHNAVSWVRHMQDHYGQKVTINEALKNISKSHFELVENTARYPKKIFTTYEDIKKDSWKEASRIAKFLEINTTPEHQKLIADLIIPEYTTIDH